MRNLIQLDTIDYIKRIWPLSRMRSETLKYGSKGRNLPPYSDRGEQAVQQGDSEIAEAWFDQAAEYGNKL